jgi:NADH-quinone oxidoreductase subunit N
MGMISMDPLSQFFKIIITATAIVVCLLADKSADISVHNKIEFYAFLAATTLGLNMLSSSTNMVMIYLSLEMASILSYLLVGYTGTKRSEEASIKYVLYGGLASGVMIYGMSLLYGLTGTFNLTEMREYLSVHTPDRLVLFITFIMILTGLGYKMAIAPFHMWSPDAYEGAPTPVTAYLSVASKAGGFAVTLRFFLVTFMDRQTVWQPLMNLDWQSLVSVLAMLTMTLGNLIALRQTNIKRFLAYSSIAHAGYMLMAIAAQSRLGVESVLFYFVTYFFMNLGAFVVVIMIANQFETEEIEDYKGLAGRSLFGLIVALCLSVFMFSLVGLPPFAGFVGKWYVFRAVLDAKLYTLALVGVLNSVVSLYYYVRIAKFMLIDEPKSDVPVQNAYLSYSAMMVAFALLTVYFGLFFGPISSWAGRSADFLY